MANPNPQLQGTTTFFPAPLPGGAPLPPQQWMGGGGGGGGYDQRGPPVQDWGRAQDFRRADGGGYYYHQRSPPLQLQDWGSLKDWGPGGGGRNDQRAPAAQDIAQNNAGGFSILLQRRVRRPGTAEGL